MKYTFAEIEELDVTRIASLPNPSNTFLNLRPLDDIFLLNERYNFFAQLQSIRNHFCDSRNQNDLQHDNLFGVAG